MLRHNFDIGTMVFLMTTDRSKTRSIPRTRWISMKDDHWACVFAFRNNSYRTLLMNECIPTLYSVSFGCSFSNRRSVSLVRIINKLFRNRRLKYRAPCFVIASIVKIGRVVCSKARNFLPKFNSYTMHICSFFSRFYENQTNENFDR